jgi:hypothetical protein
MEWFGNTWPLRAYTAAVLGAWGRYPALFSAHIILRQLLSERTSTLVSTSTRNETFQDCFRQ